MLVGRREKRKRVFDTRIEATDKSVRGTREREREREKERKNTEEENER